MAFFVKESFESRLFGQAGEPARSRLNRALREDLRHIQPESSGEWVVVIQEALNRIQSAGTIPGMRPIPVGEIDAQEFGSATRAAVLAYKADRDIRAPGQPAVDPIVGRSTLAHLDEELKGPRRPDLLIPIDPPLVTTDVVIFINGFGTPEAQGLPGSPELLLADFETPKYILQGRRLVPISFTGSHDSRNPTSRIVELTEKAFVGARRGRICIFGESAGGKNVLEVASKLNAKGFTVDYVGVADGAFDSATDPLQPPPFRLVLRSPPFTAGRKVNIFQSLCTFASVGMQGPIWKGRMPTGEIHGPIDGFSENTDLTRGQTFAKQSPDAVHTNAANTGVAAHRVNISAILGSV